MQIRFNLASLQTAFYHYYYYCYYYYYYYYYYLSQPKMGTECQANFSFLLSLSWNLKEIDDVSAISYLQAVSSGPSTFQVVL